MENTASPRNPDTQSKDFIFHVPDLRQTITLDLKTVASEEPRPVTIDTEEAYGLLVALAQHLKPELLPFIAKRA